MAIYSGAWIVLEPSQTFRVTGGFRGAGWAAAAAAPGWAAAALDCAGAGGDAPRHAASSSAAAAVRANVRIGGPLPRRGHGGRRVRLYQRPVLLAQRLPPL